MRNFLKRSSSVLAVCAFALVGACDERDQSSNLGVVENAAAVASSNQRLPQDEIIYFVLPDRFANGDVTNDEGGFGGGPMQHGFNPEHKGFFHGGDLKGMSQKLDYLQGLGVTAIWLSPIFKNKPVQGAAGEETAGYHGYWITDFLSVDPHLGTNEEFKAFVDAAHERNMLVYMDIITNHTADVISLRECHDASYNAADKVDSCDYRSISDYPFTTRGGLQGEAINEGFIGDGPEGLTEENFAKLNDVDFAYTPYVLEAEKTIKNPSWLNDISKYHNRGESTFAGESSLYGDFAGLDDIATEDPEVVAGLVEIYQHWISEYGIDGYRIDTARHVRPEFWRDFLPQIRDHAASEGKPNFHIFGEVYQPDVSLLAYHVINSELDSALDFPFQDVLVKMLVEGQTAEAFEHLLRGDVVYPERALEIMPTFTGNHDMGRFSGLLRAANPDMTLEDQLARVRLAHAIMLTSRGVPVIYYGDEQGFVSDGNDQDAREDMFESKTAVYNDNVLLGTQLTTVDDNFDTAHPLYVEIAKLSQIRLDHIALRRGKQVFRFSDSNENVLVYSRKYKDEEYVVAVNMGEEDQKLNVRVDGRASHWEAVLGACAEKSNAPASLTLNVPRLDLVICKSKIAK